MKKVDENILSADLILLNGSVLTVDDNFSRAEAVAARDGRIIMVGKNSAVKSLAGKDTRIVDLKGKSVLPGFVDVHCHMWSLGVKLSQVDCRSPPTKSIREIIKKLSSQEKKTPKDKWIIGWGYNDGKLAENRHPNRWDLDEVSKERPVSVRRVCGHTMIINSKALEIIGYSKDTPQPEGGEIDKDPRTGEPTGILREKAMKPVNDIIQAFSSKEIESQIKLACQEALKQGLTSYQEAGLTADIIRAYQNLHAKGELPIRVYMMISLDLLDSIVKTGIFTGLGDDWLKIGAIKIVMDGAIGGKTAALYEPYEGTKSNLGILYMKQEKLDRFVSSAHDAGFQVAIHAIGDRAIDICLNSLEKAIKKNPRKDHRHRIEHCALGTRSINERLKKLNILPVGQPQFFYNIGDSYIANLGAKRVEWIFPFKTWFNEGLRPSGSSDQPCADGEPLLGIWAAVNRITEAGKVLNSDERITPQQAIQMYTINSAYTNFEENVKGSIEIGKLADMVILSEDPTKVPIEQIKDIKVLSTIIAGKIAYEAT